jgi:hypothetical protein
MLQIPIVTQPAYLFMLEPRAIKVPMRMTILGDQVGSSMRWKSNSVAVRPISTVGWAMSVIGGSTSAPPGGFIEADQRHIVWNPKFAIADRLKRPGGQQAVAGKDRIGAVCLVEQCEGGIIPLNRKALQIAYSR